MEETNMEETGFLAVNMRKALTKAYCMDLDKFQDIMHYGVNNKYTVSKWRSMQSDFMKWYRHLDNSNARRFCHWVLYSED